MKNRINLENFNIRTDLIIDEDVENKVLNKELISDNLSISYIEVTKELSTLLKKKEGIYVTLEFQDITNHEDKVEIEKCLSNEIKKILKEMNLKDSDDCLVIGLGNRDSTADSLGPLVLDKVMVTRHLFLLDVK